MYIIVIFYLMHAYTSTMLPSLLGMGLPTCSLVVEISVSLVAYSSYIYASHPTYVHIYSYSVDGGCYFSFLPLLLNTCIY